MDEGDLQAIHYDVVHAAYNDAAMIDTIGATTAYDLDWEQRDRFEQRVIETYDPDLYTALNAFEQQMKTFRNAPMADFDREIIDGSTLFAGLAGKQAVNNDGKSYRPRSDSLNRSHLGSVCDVDETVTNYQVPFGVANSPDALATLMNQIDDEQTATYQQALNTYPEAYDDLFAVLENGLSDKIVETTAWQLDYAELEQKASSVRSMVDEMIESTLEEGGQDG